MLWLLWCESEDHMQVIMKETNKHRAWTQSTNHTNKPQTHNTQYLSVHVSPQSAHKHTHLENTGQVYNTKHAG